MQNNFENIAVLQKMLNDLLPMKEKDQRKLDEKFRLEFSFNSNHIEGNTLTYTETKALILKDIPPIGVIHTMRELEEMKAHDAAFEIIKTWAADKDRELATVYLKELNKIILVKDYWKDAQTADGNPSKKNIKVGEYKSTPNSVVLANGEIFHYADPMEVPAMMTDLLDWYHSQKESMHPIDLASEFHHKFVLIHPFDDGNGRISRLIVNYILLRNGLPPIVIKSAEKQKYLNALRLADAGNMSAFIDFIAEQVEWSLEISIKAANGEEIIEPDDWEKEISILSKREDSIPVKRTIDNTLHRLEDSIFPLFHKLKNKINEKFIPIFESIVITCDYERNDIIAFLDSKSLENFPNIINPESFQQIKFVLSLNNYKKNGINIFNITSVVYVDFNSRQYQIFINGHSVYLLNKVISDVLTDEDCEEIINNLGRIIVDEILIKVKK